MNILYVTPRLPYPPDTGAKIRTLNLLKQVKRAGNKVLLLTFMYEEEERQHFGEFAKMDIGVIPVKAKDTITVSAALRAWIKNVPLSIAKY